jgi:RNA polymerase sigma factor (sigma-70 family)
MTPASGDVEDITIQKAERKKDWALTQAALRNLLEWIDEGADSSGEKYLEMRRRLVAYFDRKDCATPDDLADETLNRVARRLEEEGAITDTTPAHYCYIIAKFVFLEYLRRTERGQVSLEDMNASAHPYVSPSAMSERNKAVEEREEHLGCLEHCLKSLTPENRELIVRYYQGEQRTKIENRRALAESLGITVNALSVRACRLRDRLESCVRKCLKR